ncbi:helix-turn-helix domain-containing protein [Caldinitratiruptor microaerophilus]|uniref:helix-turn-helix domain-containing protein n=1 Tax=Caldinitratiruptor microaerophilus TaxID=671077 RepID=UPI002232B758|nr:helix-turn-helix domain-containing protein [Caldinitratiruptor microaerophilus]
MNRTEEALLLNAPAVARKLGIGRDTAYGLIRAKVLPSVRVGHKVLVPARAVDELIARIMRGEITQLGA